MDAPSCKIKYMKLTPSITEYIDIVLILVLFTGMYLFNYDILKLIMLGANPTIPL